MGFPKSERAIRGAPEDLWELRGSEDAWLCRCTVAQMRGCAVARMHGCADAQKSLVPRERLFVL